MIKKNNSIREIDYFKYKNMKSKIATEWKICEKTIGLIFQKKRERDEDS